MDLTYSCDFLGCNHAIVDLHFKEQLTCGRETQHLVILKQSWLTIRNKSAPVSSKVSELQQELAMFSGVSLATNKSLLDHLSDWWTIFQRGFVKLAGTLQILMILFHTPVLNTSGIHFGTQLVEHVIVADAVHNFVFLSTTTPNTGSAEDIYSIDCS